MSDTQPGQRAPDFTLPAETVQALLAFADRHGIENVNGFVGDVGRACRAFLVVRERAKRPRMDEVELDGRLWKVRCRAKAMLKHAEALARMLEQQEVERSVHCSIMWGGPDRLWLQRGGKEFIRDLHGNLQVLAGATGAYRPPAKRGQGRPPGKDEFARILAIGLCECLAEHGVLVRQSGGGRGAAHQLLDLLRVPLNVGPTEFRKRFNEVIRDGLFNVAADIWRE